MKIGTTTAALAAVMCAAGLAIGAEPRPLPIDEAEIQAEMDALQDRSAPATSGQIEKARKLVREGAKRHDEGKLDAAIARYRAAIAVAPLHATAHYELANTLSLAGRRIESLEAITRALALNPKEEMYYVLKGNVLDDLGFTQEAKDTYRALLAVMPGSYQGLLNLGICQARANGNDEAEAALKRARDLAPDKPSAYFQLAAVARARGFDYEERALLEQFLERGQKDARAEAVRKRLDEMKQVNVPLSLDAPFPHIELALAMQRALWRNEEHRRRHPEARGYAPTFDEEKEVLGLLLSLWREKKKEDAASQHGAYDLVLAVDEAGFLDEYVYYTKQASLGDTAKTWLAEHDARLQAFLSWAREKGYLRD